MKDEKPPALPHLKGVGVRARRTFPVRRPVLGRVVAEPGLYLQQSSTSAVKTTQTSTVHKYRDKP
ncbi:hypothetical protein Taro_023489 [Colocasia esculenta]|uniref:Uncharacterized protein n=1 Tax=Colocasia esculenta TaxID=4460 RepID=A0A843V3Y2_COLES|nr:hypothetical protein [Colocasia esculenta]